MNEVIIKSQVKGALETVINNRKSNPSGHYWAILHVIVKDNYYMQFSASADDELLVDISGRHYPSKTFTKEQEDIVIDYGYKYPNRNYPNFYKIVDLKRIDLDSLTDEVFDILVRVLELDKNLPLKIEFECDENYGKDTFIRKLVSKMRGKVPLIVRGSK
jgi:hypothetical protein